jgi:hypothetical protein
MTVARVTTKILVGTDDATGVTIASNASAVGSEVDMLGNDTSTGDVYVQVNFTSTVTSGTLDEYWYPSRVSGTPASSQVPIRGSFAPINGRQNISIIWDKCNRFLTGKITNNATGANATNCSLTTELHQYS